MQYTLVHMPQRLYRSRCDSQILESPTCQQYSLVKGKTNSSPKERLHCTVRLSFDEGFYKWFCYLNSVPVGRLSGCKIKKRIIRKFKLITQNYQESSCLSPDSGFSPLYKKSSRLCSEVQLPALKDYPRNREHLK